MSYTPEEFREWAFNPVTEYHIKKLAEKREEIKEQMASNYFRDLPSLQHAIGLCRSLEATINSVESLKIIEETKDE